MATGKTATTITKANLTPCAIGTESLVKSTPCQLHEREKPDSSTAVQEGEAEGGEGPEKKRRRGTRRIKRNLPTSSVGNSDPDGSASAQAKKIARRNCREKEDMQPAIEESKITAL